MRLVLDTNVVVSGLLWAGLPRQLLKTGIHEGSLFTSVPMLMELGDVLSRPKLSGQIASSLLTVDELVRRYASLAIVVRPGELKRTAPDPDDDVVIATAIAANADLLVTGDAALLTVGRNAGLRLVSVREAVNAIADEFGNPRP